MELIKFLMENWELDNANDLDELWDQIRTKYSRNDFVELANILVLIDNIPQTLFDKIWQEMERTY